MVTKNAVFMRAVAFRWTRHPLRSTAQNTACLQKIKDYVKDKYGVNVHTSYIAQVKRMCGLDMGENYNKSKKENPEVKQCPQEKVEYIKDALKHFGLINKNI